jgi:hypothetical protein
MGVLQEVLNAGKLFKKFELGGTLFSGSSALIKQTVTTQDPQPFWLTEDNCVSDWPV